MVDRFPQALDGIAMLGRLEGPDAILRVLCEGVPEEEAQFLTAVLEMLKERFPDDESDDTPSRSIH